MQKDIVFSFITQHILPNHQPSLYQGYFYFFILLPGIYCIIYSYICSFNYKTDFSALL